MKSDLLALSAIVLWASLAALGVSPGLLALACHALFEPSVALSGRDWVLIALLGLGPLGGAFFLWDAAIKTGDPQRIGLLAFLTPLLSTLVILVSTGQPMTLHIALAAVMIVGAALWGRRV